MLIVLTFVFWYGRLQRCGKGDEVGQRSESEKIIKTRPVYNVCSFPSYLNKVFPGRGYPIILSSTSVINRTTGGTKGSSDRPHELRSFLERRRTFSSPFASAASKGLSGKRLILNESLLSP